MDVIGWLVALAGRAALGTCLWVLVLSAMDRMYSVMDAGPDGEGG